MVFCEIFARTYFTNYQIRKFSRKDLISRIAHFEIFCEDLISRIFDKFATTAKFNPREN